MNKSRKCVVLSNSFELTDDQSIVRGLSLAEYTTLEGLFPCYDLFRILTRPEEDDNFGFRVGIQKGGSPFALSALATIGYQVVSNVANSNKVLWTLQKKA